MTMPPERFFYSPQGMRRAAGNVEIDMKKRIGA